MSLLWIVSQWVFKRRKTSFFVIHLLSANCLNILNRNSMTNSWSCDFLSPLLERKKDHKMQARFFLLPLLLNTTFIPQFFHEIGVGQCIRLFKPLCQQRNSRDFSKFTHHYSFDGHHVLNMVEKICKKNCDFRAKLFMVYIRIAICYNNYSGLVKPKINGFKSFCSSLVL